MNRIPDGGISCLHGSPGDEDTASDVVVSEFQGSLERYQDTMLYLIAYNFLYYWRLSGKCCGN